MWYLFTFRLLIIIYIEFFFYPWIYFSICEHCLVIVGWDKMHVIFPA